MTCKLFWPASCILMAASGARTLAWSACSASRPGTKSAAASGGADATLPIRTARRWSKNISDWPDYRTAYVKQARWCQIMCKLWCHLPSVRFECFV